MSTTLNIIVHIYFAINLFIAGFDYSERQPIRRLSEHLSAIFYTAFFSFFGCAFYTIIVIIASLRNVYKRTYVNYGITTFRTWYRFVYRGKNIKLDGYQLRVFKKNVMINRMPGVWKNWWMKFLDEQIDKKKKELFDKYGEVTDFK